jgi:ABC-2 type transport system permease protein
MELGPTIRVVTRMWYNPNLQSRLNFVPGLLGILLVIVTTVVMSMNIVREKEIGTLEQVMVTPLSATQIITGKLVPFMLLGLGQFGVGVLATGVVFGIWATGSLLVLFVLAAVFCFSNLGLGLFISTVAKTQAEAMFIAWFFMIYSMILSGFFVPLENVPQFMRVVAAVNPLRYFIVVLREVYLEGAGFRYLWKEALAMGAIGMVTLMLAALRFRKRLS